MARTARTATRRATRKSDQPRLVAVLSPHVVDKEEPRGDRSKTQETVEQWTPGQKRCRARGRHNWGPFTVREHRTYYDVIERCRDCLNRRHADYIKTQWGLRKSTDWKPDYRDGYLLPKGAARLDEEITDGLVAADILSRRIIEVTDEEEEMRA